MNKQEQANQEWLESESAAFSDEEKAIIKKLVKDEETYKFLKKYFLGGANQQGNMEDLMDKHGNNWVLNIPTSLPNEEYATRIKHTSGILTYMSTKLARMEYIASKDDKPKREVINEAK